MRKIEIYDPALCCRTGVCGVDVDQSLVDFASDIDWAKKEGANIVRYNLGQEPLKFADREVVKSFLERAGAEGLPLILLDGEVVLAGRYPKRKELARWLGVTLPESSSGGCCSGGGCC